MDLWELSFLGMVSEWEQNVRDGWLLVNRRFLLLRWLEAAPFFLISPPHFYSPYETAANYCSRKIRLSRFSFYRPASLLTIYTL